MPKASDTPRTRSALPIFSRNEPVLAARVACSSEVNGVCQICIGWTRVGSFDSARKTTSLPSSNSE